MNSCIFYRLQSYDNKKQIHLHIHSAIHASLLYFYASVFLKSLYRVTHFNFFIRHPTCLLLLPINIFVSHFSYIFLCKHAHSPYFIIALSKQLLDTVWNSNKQNYRRNRMALQPFPSLCVPLYYVMFHWRPALPSCRLYRQESERINKMTEQCSVQSYVLVRTAVFLMVEVLIQGGKLD